MRCLHHSAFWFATFASSLFGFATFLPLWLGRLTDGALRFYALWYQLLCKENSCSSFELMFQNKNVEGNYDFQLIVLPMCALVATVCSFVGVILLEILSCDCGRKVNCNPRPIIVFCTILFWITAVFSGLVLFISIVVCIEFFKNDGIDHAGEFPWCTLMFGIGFLLMVITAVLFTVIVCRWDVYGPFYGYMDWRTLDYVDNLNTGSYHRNPSVMGGKSVYSESIKRSYRDTPSLRESFKSFKGSPMPSRESKKIPGFAFGALSYAESGKGDLRRSDYGGKFRNTSDGSLVDFRLRNSKKASSVSDLRESKRKSIYDSPSILRHQNASEYIRDERNSLRESKKLHRAASMDEIDPKRLQTGYTAYRESRVDKEDSKYADFTRAERHSDRESKRFDRASSVDEIDPKRLQSGYTAYRESRGEDSKDYDISPIGSRTEMSGFRPGNMNILDVLYKESRKANM